MFFFLTLSTILSALHMTVYLGGQSRLHSLIYGCQGYHFIIETWCVVANEDSKLMICFLSKTADAS